jgi:two-component system LytT family response regulator
MSPIKALIIDDEPQSRSVLADMLHAYFPTIVSSHQADSVSTGLEQIKELQPDMVLLDIQMKGETGFDLLRTLGTIEFAVVFTTAFDQYAIRAFRFNAIDYLLKPIIREELIEAVNKVLERRSSLYRATMAQLEELSRNMKNPLKMQEKIAVPTEDGFILIPIAEILYCRASGNYTQFCLAGGKEFLSSYTLKQYDQLLSPQHFFRAHRSFLVNLAHIKKFRKGDGGSIVMSNDDEIELSQAHKSEFIRFIKGDL